MDKVAVLIPCYNESKTVKKVVEDFRRSLPEAAIYVYDNNSTDGTEQLAREMSDVLNHYKDELRPAIILIPGREGSLGIGRDNIQRAIERAVGADIL